MLLFLYVLQLNAHLEVPLLQETILSLNLYYLLLQHFQLLFALLQLLRLPLQLNA